MTILVEMLLNEKDMLAISHLELVERLAIVRHISEFDFYYAKYASRLATEETRVLLLPPSELFHQIRNYAFYLLFQEKDHRDQFRVCLDYISLQRSNNVLILEELELLRLSLAFFLRQQEHGNPHVLWSVACDIFLREPYEEDSRDYHSILVNSAPEQATESQRNRLLAWGEFNPDMLLDIVAILRKHHKELGQRRLDDIKSYILNKCNELDEPVTTISKTK